MGPEKENSDTAKKSSEQLSSFGPAHTEVDVSPPAGPEITDTQ